MDRWRISSIDMDAGNLLLVKCSQTLSSWIKKSSSLFLQIPVRYLRICFCLKRVKSWLEFSIKSIFSQYSMRSFQRAFMEFNNFWINFIFREFNWVSMSKMSKERLSVWEVWFFLLFRRKLYILFSISFLIYFGIVYIWTMYQSLDKSWFIIIFLPLKESLALFQIWSFLLSLHLFCPNWSYREKNLQN